MSAETRANDALRGAIASERLRGYVSLDDDGLGKKEFLKLVADRIYDDLGLSAPKPKRAKSTHGVTIKPTQSFISSYKQGSLSSSVTIAQIRKTLPGIDKGEGDGGEKVIHEWQFLADGKPCAIWDYKGARWSTFGPKEIFDKLFGAENHTAY